MIMNPVQHPDDERLSAYTAGDDDARDDRSLHLHVEGCDRCRNAVAELASLRAHLAAMPDLAPARPIRLVLPEREPAAPRGFAELVRRLFAPALAAGATLALVGAVGLGAQGLGSAASAPASGAFRAELSVESPAASEAAAAQEDTGAAGGGSVAGASQPEMLDALRPESSERALSAPEVLLQASPEPATGIANPGPSETTGAEFPWLPLFVAGVALAGAALFLRFAIMPRAG